MKRKIRPEDVVDASDLQPIPDDGINMNPWGDPPDESEESDQVAGTPSYKKQHLDPLTVFTGEDVFTGADSVALADLIFKRFGRKLNEATAAWNRLLGVNITEKQFEDLRVLAPHFGQTFYVVSTPRRDGRFNGFHKCTWNPEKQDSDGPIYLTADSAWAAADEKNKEWMGENGFPIYKVFRVEVSANSIEAYSDWVLGQEVDIPEPQSNDSWNHGFTAQVVSTKFDTDGSLLLTVRDQEDNHFDIEARRIML